MVNPILQALQTGTKATWRTLMGHEVPKWSYPLFGLAAAAPLVGYALDRKKNDRQTPREEDAPALKEKAAGAIAEALGVPETPDRSVYQLAELRAFLRKVRESGRTETAGSRPSLDYLEGVVPSSAGNDTRHSSIDPRFRA